MSKLKHEGILAEAQRVTCDRQDNYGHPRANHIRIANLWNAYIASKNIDNHGNKILTEIPILTPSDVTVMMVQLKQARHIHKPSLDNMVDQAGYLRCQARIEGFEE